MNEIIQLLLRLLSVGTGQTQLNFPQGVLEKMSSHFPNFHEKGGLPGIYNQMNDYSSEEYYDTPYPHHHGLRGGPGHLHPYEQDGKHLAKAEDEFNSEEYYDRPNANPTRTHYLNRKQNHVPSFAHQTRSQYANRIQNPSFHPSPAYPHETDNYHERTYAYPTRSHFPSARQDHVRMGSTNTAPLHPFENEEQYGSPQAYQNQPRFYENTPTGNETPANNHEMAKFDATRGSNPSFGGEWTGPIRSQDHVQLGALTYPNKQDGINDNMYGLPAYPIEPRLNGNPGGSNRPLRGDANIP